MELAKLPDGAKGMVDEKHGYAYTMYKGIPYPPFMIPESVCNFPPKMVEGSPPIPFLPSRNRHDYHLREHLSMEATFIS